MDVSFVFYPFSWKFEYQRLQDYISEYVTFVFYPSSLIVECPAGYFGEGCSKMCPLPMYGHLCVQTCSCFPCHHIYGCNSTQGTPIKI